MHSPKSFSIKVKNRPSLSRIELTTSLPTQQIEKSKIYDTGGKMVEKY